MKNTKRNYSWIYIIIAAIIAIPVIFIALQFYVSNSRSPVETNWSKVKSTMLASNDIERIVVVNDKQAKIYIKKERLKNYEQEFSDNFSKPSDAGPHFFFNIGSVETFERNLSEAQKDSLDEILPEYKEETNWAGEILWTVGPFLLIFIIILGYFIPSWIARDKENYRSILVLNLLTGWSIIGWIGALYWAITSPEKQGSFEHICSKCGYKKNINQKVKLFVCSNCNMENIVEQ